MVVCDGLNGLLGAVNSVSQKTVRTWTNSAGDARLHPLPAQNSLIRHFAERMSPTPASMQIGGSMCAGAGRRWLLSVIRFLARLRADRRLGASAGLME
jgi:hypothetical protein